MTCTLYRHFDASGALLYVGIAKDALRRTDQHIAKSHWAHQMARVTFEHFDSRKSAEVAERRAILEERPAFNIQLAAREGSKFADVAQRLQSLRVVSGLNQSEYARSLGFNPTQYSNWENGIRQPSVAAAIKICEAEGITLDWIFRGIA